MTNPETLPSVSGNPRNDLRLFLVSSSALPSLSLSLSQTLSFGRMPTLWIRYHSHSFIYSDFKTLIERQYGIFHGKIDRSERFDECRGYYRR